MMENKIGRHFFITGQVQGVWYRACAQKQAIKLEITGWAKNLSDGRVEVLACGEKDQVEQFSAWLSKGPPLAKVQAVEAQAIPWQNLEQFRIK